MNSLFSDISASSVRSSDEEDVADSTFFFSGRTSPEKRLELALGSNLLMDVLLIPDVGLEALWGSWSLAADGAFAWWSLKSKHYYWRYYGVDLSLRRYFHAPALPEVLRHYFVGAYAGVCSYDLELGESGRMADPEKGKLECRCGLEVGFRYPVYDFLSLEVSLGMGCSWGRYDVYTPMDGHYVWQWSRAHQTWRPNRIQVSLWLPMDFFMSGKEVSHEK